MKKAMAVEAVVCELVVLGLDQYVLDDVLAIMLGADPEDDKVLQLVLSELKAIMDTGEDVTLMKLDGNTLTYTLGA